MASASAKTAPAAPVSSPVSSMSTHREQRLRAALTKKFPLSALKPLGFGDVEILTATAPADMTFAEALAPAAWSGVAAIVARDPLNTRNLRDGVGNIVFVDHEKGAYFAILRIMKVVRDALNNPCGLEVACIGPSLDLKTGEARPIDLATGKAWVDPETVG